MKLYYSPGACSLADHIALIEADLPYELEKVDLKSKRTEDGEDYTAINPKGYVPALLLDDDHVLTENVAILSYIGDEAPALMPDGGAYWRVLEMLAFISSEVHKSFAPLFHGGSEEEKSAARETLGKRFAYLSKELGDREDIVGDHLSVADCYLFVMLMWALGKANVDVPEPLKAYYQRLKARPAFAKALSEEGLGA